LETTTKIESIVPVHTVQGEPTVKFRENPFTFLQKSCRKS